MCSESNKSKNVAPELPYKWADSTTRKLIGAYKKSEYVLQQSGNNDTTVWNTVVKAMADEGYVISRKHIENKIKGLKRTYRYHKERDSSAAEIVITKHPHRKIDC